VRALLDDPAVVEDDDAVLGVDVDVTSIQAQALSCVLVPNVACPRRWRRERNLAYLQLIHYVARPGLEPGTPRFSVVRPLTSASVRFAGNSLSLATFRRPAFSRTLRSFPERYGRRRGSSAFSEARAEGGYRTSLNVSIWPGVTVAKWRWSSVAVVSSCRRSASAITDASKMPRQPMRPPR
jgi:hypothetical protein